MTARSHTRTKRNRKRRLAAHYAKARAANPNTPQYARRDNDPR